jgi:hypothetical protein
LTLFLLVAFGDPRHQVFSAPLIYMGIDECITILPFVGCKRL